MDLWSLSSSEHEYHLAHCCIKDNWSRVVLHKLFRNPTTEIVSIVSSFPTSHEYLCNGRIQRASTVGNWAILVPMVLPTRTSFVTMITYVSCPTIWLNDFSTSLNSLHWGRICCMLRERKSMIVRDTSTQRRNQETGIGMMTYMSWILTSVHWVWPLQNLH